MIFKAILDVKESIYNTLSDVFKLRKPQRDFLYRDYVSFS